MKMQEIVRLLMRLF